MGHDQFFKDFFRAFFRAFCDGVCNKIEIGGQQASQKFAVAGEIVQSSPDTTDLARPGERGIGPCRRHLGFRDLGNL